MDLNKIGSSLWSESGSIPNSGKAVDIFVKDASDPQLANSISDILELNRSRTSRQYLDVKISKSNTQPLPMTNSLTSPTNDVKPNYGGGPVSSKQSKGALVQQLRKSLQAGALLNVFEKPPDRKDIAILERDLIENVKQLMSESISDMEELETGASYHPQRVKFAVTKRSLLKHFRCDEDDLKFQPWLDRLIKCSSLEGICDDTSGKLADMISVSSADLGNVLRKLVKTYKQTFQLMRSSWEELYNAHKETKRELSNCLGLAEILKYDVANKESGIRERLDEEVKQVTDSYEMERKKDREHLLQTELELERTSETLKTLNAIFKTMQTDSSVTSTGDMMSRCERLQKEANSLRNENMGIDVLKKSLEDSNAKIDSLKRQIKQQDVEIATVRAQLHKRDETIATLMERDALRNSEIEKLQKMANLLAEKDENQDVKFEEPPSSVLCVKCKKGLDDLTNIRAAVIGTAADNKLQCKTFRILLPNLKGRRPHRDMNWTRFCMRAIMSMKMREDVALIGIKGETSRFPEFVYSWFEPDSTLTGGAGGGDPQKLKESTARSFEKKKRRRSR